MSEIVNFDVQTDKPFDIIAHLNQIKAQIIKKAQELPDCTIKQQYITLANTIDSIITHSSVEPAPSTEEPDTTTVKPEELHNPCHTPQEISSEHK